MFDYDVQNDVFSDPLDRAVQTDYSEIVTLFYGKVVFIICDNIYLSISFVWLHRQGVAISTIS